VKAQGSPGSPGSTHAFALALFIADAVQHRGLHRVAEDHRRVARLQTQYTWVVTATCSPPPPHPDLGQAGRPVQQENPCTGSGRRLVLGSVAAGLVRPRAAHHGAGGAGCRGRRCAGAVQIAIAALIPAEERGRYNGYLSSVTATSTIGGPLLGGLLSDTSWLGWRWCFLIGIPLAAVRRWCWFQKTLRLPTVRRAT